MSFRPAIAFAAAAPRYWCSVYPRVRVEVERLHSRAQAIPEPQLRAIALQALDEKRANLDGAAAFAAFVPAARRGAVVRAQVAFQALYDYLDVLTERPSADPVARSRWLHGALTAAVEPDNRKGGGPADGTAIADWAVAGDGGYLQETVEQCRTALRALPGYGAVEPSARRLAGQIVEFQSFNVIDAPQPRAELARWAGHSTPPGSGLAWWETAASAGSSLGVFALIAMAAEPSAEPAHARAVEDAYFPWVGALHSLLDSLIDRDEDRASGQQVLIEHYGGPGQVATGLRALAHECRRRASALPDSERHLAILASMAGLYLAERQARLPYASEARCGVLDALGPLTVPAMVLARARRLVL
jgi:tetraprenyl-beta-curcumene synthase